MAEKKNPLLGWRGLYLFWVIFWFVGIFLMIFPFVALFIQKKSWHRFYYPWSKVWSIPFYVIIFFPVKSVWYFKPQKGQNYVFCPNHFSYVDIPLLTRTARSFSIFVGLHDLKNIPLFGYMYRNIHITINRESGKDRLRAYKECLQTLEEGKDLVIFPEGGIWTEPEDMPQVSPFKEGPFRIAIEKQVPIVPVSIPFNWKIMPLLEYKEFRWHRSVVVYHEAIPTIGLTKKDIPELQKKVYDIIQSEINQWNQMK